MRDLVLREALNTMARDAARCFRGLVAAGEEIPYDVEEASSGSPLPRYVALTERFVRDHAPNLSELDSFGAACAAIESAGLAGPYLEDFGIAVPPDARRRAELAGTVFLCRLWMDSSDFSLDRDRLDATIAEIEANGEADPAEIEVIVPLRGLQLPVGRLDLATATIVRADGVDVPGEARGGDGLGVAAWEPVFLAATRTNAGEDLDPEAGPDAGVRAVEAFRALITTLHLFKEGGVALGAHAWTRKGEGRWRRVSTGAARPRPGGYRLTESELPQLVSFSRALASRTAVAGARPSHRAGALARSISRFEAGLERHVVVEALNDYLLSLRFLLEGGGPADLGLAMRVAALCAEPERRGEVKAVIDHALSLERELWSGEPPPDPDRLPPAQVAAEVEDLSRAILKDAACGHLGSDLRATADEILLADGLAVGDGAQEQRGGTAEWSATELAETMEWDLSDPEIDVEMEAVEPVEPVAPVEPIEAFEPVGADPRPEAVAEAAAEEPPTEVEAPSERFVRRPGYQHDLWLDALDDADAGDGWLEPSRQGRGPRARIMSADAQRDEETVMAGRPQQGGAGEATSRAMRALERLNRSPETRLDADAERPVDRLIELHSVERDAVADRVANLFPRPETTEWNVRELDYDRRRRRSQVGA